MLSGLSVVGWLRAGTFDSTRVLMDSSDTSSPFDSSTLLQAPAIYHSLRPTLVLCFCLILALQSRLDVSIIDRAVTQLSDFALLPVIPCTRPIYAPYIANKSCCRGYVLFCIISLWCCTFYPQKLRLRPQPCSCLVAPCPIHLYSTLLLHCNTLLCFVL